MNTRDLLLLLENPSLSRTLLNILSSDEKSMEFKNTSLEEFLLSESNSTRSKASVPEVVDLRDKGHRAASQFVSEYTFKVGQRFTVWYGGHESSLRNALERKGLRPSITTLLKGKKYQIQIEKAISPKNYAKKKGA